MNPLTVLGIKALAVLAAAFAIGWAIHALDQSRQQLGYDRRVAEDNAALIEAQAAALAEERRLKRQLEDAQNDAAKRNLEIRLHADAAGLAVAGLRDELDAWRNRLPADTVCAGPDAAATVAELFGDCAERYRSVAEAADRHASDASTLMNGWPR